MKSIKHSIVKRFPFVLFLKGWWVAWRDHLSQAKESYSQAGEDSIIAELLTDTDASASLYLDIGANHPTRLSNTYGLYRKGWQGIIVEPNTKLLAMHKRLRPRDEQLAVACGTEPGVLHFQHAVSHVLSGFAEGDMKTKDFRRSELMPILTVDVIMQAYPDKEIALLSIDVEGFDFEVAQGAAESLSRTKVVCIEGEESHTELMDFFLAQGFKLHRNTRHNLIFVSGSSREVSKANLG